MDTEAAEERRSERCRQSCDGGDIAFIFFSNEGYEPPHIHVDRAGNSVKYWPGAVRLARNFGFSEREVNVIEHKVREEEPKFLARWNEYFGGNA